jgi:hypothetical protein
VCRGLVLRIPSKHKVQLATSQAFRASYELCLSRGCGLTSVSIGQTSPAFRLGKRARRFEWTNEPSVSSGLTRSNGVWCADIERGDMTLRRGVPSHWLLTDPWGEASAIRPGRRLVRERVLLEDTA